MENGPSYIDLINVKYQAILEKEKNQEFNAYIIIKVKNFDM